MIGKFFSPLPCFLLALSCMPVAASDRPNIIVIMADDLGYGDLGCYGSEVHATPNIDRLAAEGMRFTQFYMSASICTPSRVSFMTGRHAYRTGFIDLLWPHTTTALPQEEVTLPEILSAHGYVTGLAGKWHMGHGQAEDFPNGHGFDSWYGMPYPNDMGPGHPLAERLGWVWPEMPMYRDGVKVEEPIDSNLLTQQYTAEAVRFISEHHRRPFFLFVAHAQPHTIVGASPDFVGTSGNGLYGDAVQEIDWSVGEILRTLRAFGLEGNTFIFFTSDNGAALHNPGFSEAQNRWLHPDLTYGSNAPLRGGKVTMFEGGLRVPGIAYWPGRIQPGQVEEAPAIINDLYPTLIEMAGAALPQDRVIDAETILPVLTGQGSRVETDFLFGNHGISAIRSGKWKLHLPPHTQRLGDLGDGPLLYDLEADPGELHNLAEAHPEVVQSLVDRVEAYKVAADPPEHLKTSSYWSQP